MSIFYSFFGKILYYLYLLFNNYGLAIIVFTILWKLILLPLNIKSTNSTREIQKLQPTLKVLQKKYQNNPNKLNTETQRLYSIYKVNPLGGCLPLLVQLPIIYMLYGALRNPDTYVFPAGSTNISQSFLWIPTLEEPDPYFILPILCVVFTFLTSKFSSTANQGMADDSQASTQNMMLYMMPLLIGFMALSLPSGIALYWVTQNIFTFLQQFIMLRKKVVPIPVDEALAELESKKQEEIKVKRQHHRESSERFEELSNPYKKKNQKSHTNLTRVKTVPAKKNRKTITKIPQKKED